MRTTFLLFLIQLIFLPFFAQEIRHCFSPGCPSPEYCPGKIYKDGLQLDSINGYSNYSANDSSLTHQSTFHYDEKGRIIFACSGFRRIKDDKTLSEWDTSYSFQYVYDNNNVVQSFITDIDEPYQMKTDYIFNEKNILVSEVYSRTFDKVTWDTIEILDIEYNNDNRIISEIRYDYRFKTYMKSDYEYDIYGNITQKEVTNLLGTEEEYYEGRHKFIYDEKNQLQIFNNYFCNEDFTLYLGQKEVYNYEDDLVSNIISYSYRDDGSNWSTTKETFTYNLDNKKINKEYSQYEDTKWIFKSRESFAYNDKGLLMIEENYNWKNELWRQVGYNYDDAGNITAKYYYFSPQSNYYYYSKSLLAFNKSSFSNDYQIYPNPAKDFIYIKSSELQLNTISYNIYNLSGQIVKLGNLNTQKAIDISKLHKGLYFIKLKFNSGIICKKILIE